jgi:tetratricopeptide (TPR) repeat protein
VIGLLLYYVVFFGSVSALILRTRRRSRDQGALALLQRSFQQIGLGRLDDAEVNLTAAEQIGPRAEYRRLISVQRALVALRRGALAEALPELDALLETHASRETEGAYAMRAFVRASLGQHEDARVDIAMVRASEHARPESLARAALAEAIVFFATGERDALRALLERDRTLILENNHPRERAIARGLQRFLRSKTSSVYRVAGPRASEPPAGDEPELAEWVRRVAPAIAPFIRAPRALTHSAPSAPLRPRDGHASSVPVARPPQRRARMGAALALVGAMGMIVLFWPMLSYLNFGALIIPVAGAVGFGIFRMTRALIKLVQRRAPRLPNILEKATASIGRGDLEGAVATLGSLAESRVDLVAAQARLLLARVAEQRGDFEAALKMSELGLARLSEAKMRAAVNALFFDLAAERALALAALDRFDDAHAELARLGPTYPSRLRAGFRVRLVELARTGKIREAMRWADTYQTDLPLSVREELLADLARAVAAESGPAELQRLADELALPESRAWISRIAPELLARFEDGPRIDLPDAQRLRIVAATSSDEEAELEQMAIDDGGVVASRAALASIEHGPGQDVEPASSARNVDAPRAPR